MPPARAQIPRSVERLLREVGRLANQRGMLAKVAAAIAEAESNIENISVTNEGKYTSLHFTLEVNNRLHLANVMRSLRKVPEVVRIIRGKSTA